MEPVGRLLDGISGGNFTVAQSCIADVTTAKDRARGLGLTGAALRLASSSGQLSGASCPRSDKASRRTSLRISPWRTR